MFTAKMSATDQFLKILKDVQKPKLEQTNMLGALLHIKPNGEWLGWLLSLGQ